MSTFHPSSSVSAHALSFPKCPGHTGQQFQGYEYLWNKDLNLDNEAFWDAQAVCESFGANLASVHSVCWEA